MVVVMVCLPRLRLSVCYIFDCNTVFILYTTMFKLHAVPPELTIYIRLCLQGINM